MTHPDLIRIKHHYIDVNGDEWRIVVIHITGRECALERIKDGRAGAIEFGKNYLYLSPEGMAYNDTHQVVNGRWKRSRRDHA